MRTFLAAQKWDGKAERFIHGHVWRRERRVWLQTTSAKMIYANVRGHNDEVTSSDAGKSAFLIETYISRLPCEEGDFKFLSFAVNVISQSKQD